MKRLLPALCLGLALVMPGTAQAWGPTGHRVVAELGDRFVCGQTRLEIRDLLGTETLADAANWPDYMRLSPDPHWHDRTFPWHFVTIPDGQGYAATGAPPEGDAVSALAQSRATVLDRSAPLEDRRAALRMIVHFVGDLNQPLHAGNATDRGGNDAIVTMRGEDMNLHSVWDNALIDLEQMSWSEWADFLERNITSEQAIAWSGTDPVAWADESRGLHGQIYPEVSSETEKGMIDSAYIFRTRPLVHQQLTKAGLRLASYLDAAFGHCAGGTQVAADGN
ncbi:S1/P1 nuclease [Croceibacterium mercuriale]|uniref:S1/P1 nuclease n=1 Tax=Croceibacterium mercuriale TaxID=1572751 RepID=UPI0009E09180|nr:S1/P1 nuclease [Croceibacterium mercuriale]